MPDVAVLSAPPLAAHPAAAPAVGAADLGSHQRWARQSALPGIGTAGQRRLLAASVVVVGAGGLGSALLPVLAAAGVGRIVVVDDDDVELTNLHRQTLYRADDVGRPKAVVAAAALERLGTGSVEAVRTRVDARSAHALIADADLVVDGTDSPATRYALDDAAAAAGVPLVWGSALGWAGQVGVAWSGRGPRWRDLFPVEADDADTCATSGVLPAVCTTVGGLMAAEVLKLLTGAGRPMLGRLLVVDALAGTVREVAFAASGASGAAGAAASERRPADEDAPAEADEADSVPPDLTAPELADRLAGDESVQLLDVRQPWEAAIAAIPGAVLIPLGELPSRTSELDRAREVLTVCHSGVRSAKAAELLRELGFRARSVAGGVDAWSREVDPSVPRY